MSIELRIDFIMLQGTLHRITFDVSVVIDIDVIKEVINKVNSCQPFGPFPYCLFLSIQVKGHSLVDAYIKATFMLSST